MAYDPNSNPNGEYFRAACSAAKANDWRTVQHNRTSRVIAFVRYNSKNEHTERINVYYTTRTIGTCIDHPKRKKTQLFRRNQSISSMEKIFENPRVHTGEGYYYKSRYSSMNETEQPSDLGSGIWASLSDDKQLDYLLNTFNGSETDVVALSSYGYFVLEHDGNTWWSSIPKGLDDKLRGRQAWLPKPDYVSIGADGESYYVAFCDGKSQWSGPKSLSKALYESDETVKILQFTCNGGWYVQWDDGSAAWEDIPDGLHNQMNSRRKDLAGVENVAMGPNGEWFVKFYDDSWRAGNIDNELSKTLDKIKKKGDDVQLIEFGENGSFVVRYS